MTDAEGGEVGATAECVVLGLSVGLCAGCATDALADAKDTGASTGGFV